MRIVTSPSVWGGLTTGRELNTLNEPDGNARTYTFTVDPTIRIPLRGA